MKTLLILLFFLSSCSSIDVLNELDLPSSENISYQKYESSINSGLSDWKLRHKRSNLLSFLKNFGIAARSSTEFNSTSIERDKIYEMLSRGYYILGYYHEKNLEKSKKYWQIGASYAEKGLMLNQKFKESVGKYGEYAPALKYVKNNQIGSLYWYLANIGMWAKNSGVSTTLKYLKLIKTMMRRIENSEPRYFYNGLGRYRGAYFAVIPSYAGGSISKSRDFFLKAINSSPEYLGTKVLYAKIYALKTRNKALFEKLLNEVVNSKKSSDNNITSENIMEKAEAKKLLGKVDVLF